MDLPRVAVSILKVIAQPLTVMAVAVVPHCILYITGPIMSSATGCPIGFD